MVLGVLRASADFWMRASETPFLNTWRLHIKPPGRVVRNRRGGVSSPSFPNYQRQNFMVVETMSLKTAQSLWNRLYKSCHVIRDSACSQSWGTHTLDLGALEEIKGSTATRQHSGASLRLQGCSGLMLCSWEGAVIKNRAPGEYRTHGISAWGPRKSVSWASRVAWQ